MSVIISLLVTLAAASPVVGGDKDAHGCIRSAGYTWCESTQQCQRPWEVQCPAVEKRTVVGGDKDAHGCIGSAGYTWCESAQQCQRPWEVQCVA
ncbi:hypothetical protein HDV01_003232 [Terramyces sp. JEL0728]|nr:hypothetical protein HDV01_003232 [Terramyces sp. JEL0728]